MLLPDEVRKKLSMYKVIVYEDLISMMETQHQIVIREIAKMKWLVNTAEKLSDDYRNISEHPEALEMREDIHEGEGTE